MAKRSYSRRQFLQVSALSSSALLMSSCTTLDNLVMGDKADLENAVVILGAGASGLAAAYALKKRKIPFKIFEASSRIGGRVQTVNVFSQPSARGELGAEFFEEQHRAIFEIAKDLNLPISEVKSSAGLEAHLFSFHKENYKVASFANKMSTLQRPLRRIRSDLYRDQEVVLSYKNAQQYERSVYYDSLSLAALLQLWSSEVDPLVLSLIEAQAVARFGVDAKNQSALHFLSTLDAESSSLLSGRPIYRFEGGLSRLMQNMYDRVSGVIPGAVVMRSSPLEEISEKDGTFELTFKTADGRQRYTTQNIICTIPFSCLRNVKGIGKLKFSDLKHEVIKNQNYATHSKGTLAFTSPFWRESQGNQRGSLGNLTGDFLSQKFWDSGRTQEGTQGLLTYQRAGESGLVAGANSSEEAVADLKLFYKNIPERIPQGDQFVNWVTRPWSKGSMAVFAPGQYMKYRGVAGESEYQGRFLFAGEHTSLRFAGTLQGALESGVVAAAAIQAPTI